MLKNSAGSGKAEVKAKVEAKMKKVRSSLNLDLNRSLPRLLRPCSRNGAYWRSGVGRVSSLAILSTLRCLLLWS